MTSVENPQPSREGETVVGPKRQKDWWDGVFDDGPAAKRGCFGCLTVLGIGALALFGYTVYSFQQSAVQHVKDEQAAEVERATRGPSETNTNAMCDLAVKSVLVSEDSFDPEWGGSFHAEGDIGVVSKKFDSTNGFGAKLTSRYTCKWNSKTDTIVSLEVTDPYGETRKLR
ncbi:hypothetical protein [Novosphingobium lindaniclasticum]|uniref:Uncharacterized protein n=1 Tax=Novosphingobium lindaniclasticum LE124 TaxID=1096930 RepID=T0IKK6_9SPHN|nr:hypothetical protein [Novosphingobium lindaniclasticum]EQB12265.1 hypothetical protein L284_15580 [Novosphingobium lindaniclasticum LE124]